MIIASLVRSVWAMDSSRNLDLHLNVSQIEVFYPHRLRQDDNGILYQNTAAADLVNTTSTNDSNNIFRQLDLIFFVALPFTILYNNLTLTIVDYLTHGLLLSKGYSPEVVGLQTDDRILGLWTSHLYFVWINSIVWPLSISLNYAMEKLNDNQNLKNQMKQTQYLSHFYQNAFQ